MKNLQKNFVSVLHSKSLEVNQLFLFCAVQSVLIKPQSKILNTFCSLLAFNFIAKMIKPSVKRLYSNPSKATVQDFVLLCGFSGLSGLVICAKSLFDQTQ